MNTIVIGTAIGYILGLINIYALILQPTWGPTLGYGLLSFYALSLGILVVASKARGSL